MTQEEQTALVSNTIIPLIKENGVEVVLVKPASTEVGSGYVPGEGFTTAGIPTESKGFGLFISSDDNLLDNSLAQLVTKTMLCVSIPKPDPLLDTLEVEGVQYKVYHVGELKPGAVTMLYTLYLGE